MSPSILKLEVELLHCAAHVVYRFEVSVCIIIGPENHIGCLIPELNLACDVS